MLSHVRSHLFMACPERGTPPLAGHGQDFVLIEPGNYTMELDLVGAGPLAGISVASTTVGSRVAG